MMNEKTLQILNFLLAGQKMAVQQMEQLEDGELAYQLPLLRAMAECTEKTIECIEKKLPLLSSWYYYGPEIYTAMDLHWYSFNTSFNLSGMISGDLLIQNLEQVDKMSVPKDICTLQREILHAVETSVAPVPTVNISAATPCDGVGLMSDKILQYPGWKDVPTFRLDPPYWDDDRSLDYYSEEFKKMVSFLEENTGKKLDIDRLREVIKESNIQYELWMEYNELKRTVPCPHPSFSGNAIYIALQNTPNMVGTPKGTEYVKGMVEDAEKQVREKKAAVPDEKIRLLWIDITPVWSMELAEWLKEEWNAVIAMDMIGNTPYTLIDPTNEKTMLKGLARRGLWETPMVRQSKGTVDLIIQDITRITRDYKIDCVIGPGHMGHKDNAASFGILREVCREIGVPFLFFQMDVFDPAIPPWMILRTRSLSFS